MKRIKSKYKSNFKMQSVKCKINEAFHFAFCILHFALSRLLKLKPELHVRSDVSDLVPLPDE